MRWQRAEGLARAGRKVRQRGCTGWITFRDGVFHWKGSGYTSNHWPSLRCGDWCALKPATSRADLREQLEDAKDENDSRATFELLLKAKLAKATERYECADRCIAQLQAELEAMTRVADEQRERRKEAEARLNEVSRVQWYETASARLATIGKLEAELAEVRAELQNARDLESECAKQKAVRPEPLLLRLLRENPGKVIRSRVDSISYKNLTGHVVYLHGSFESGWKPSLAMFEDDTWYVVEPAKPAEPEWHPCSASEARNSHGGEKRVRHASWRQDLWLFRASASDNWRLTRELLEDLNNGSLADDDWCWAEPVKP